MSINSRRFLAVALGAGLSLALVPGAVTAQGPDFGGMRKKQALVTSQTVTMKGNEILLPAGIYFEYRKVVMRGQCAASMDQLFEFLKAHSEFDLVRIEGHSHRWNNAVEELDLSCERAYEVCKILVRMGIPAKRLLPVGFGSAKLGVGNRPDKLANERVRVFAVLKNKKHLDPGMPVDGGGKIVSTLSNLGK